MILLLTIIAGLALIFGIINFFALLYLISKVNSIDVSIFALTKAFPSMIKDVNLIIEKYKILFESIKSGP